MNAQSKILAPIADVISAFLYALFAPGFVHPYPEAWIEIAYGVPEEGPNKARFFSAFDLEAAAKFAADKNQCGHNVYVGAALRHGEKPRSGRASDEHFLAARYSWCEYDCAGDHERIEAILKAEELQPALMVVTGTKPHQRAHLYFLNAQPVTDGDEIRACNAALEDLLDSDDVKNSSRVLRLAGTVNYPKASKRAKGYVAEATTLHVKRDAPAYSVAALCALQPDRAQAADSKADPFEEYGSDYDLEADPELIAAALEYIRNNEEDWGDWNRIAMAAWRATNGSPVAFAAFDKWSRKSRKYNARETWRKWEVLSKSPPNRIGAGTIFMMAAEHGWVRPRDERAEDQADDGHAGTQSDADTTAPPPPGMGHNSKHKLPLHIVIANIYIADMKKGVGQLLRRVPDLKGIDHVWRYRDGLWSLQSDKDVARSLHPQLQQIVNDLGKEDKSKVSTFNEATAHILRSAEVCNHEPVTFDAHGKVPTLGGLIDPITHDIEPFKPEHFATWCLPICYDANAACPHWELLLNDAFADMSDGDRKITVELVQELVGMALIDHKPKSLSRALVFFGFPDTGKTVILKVFIALFGAAITTTFAKLEGNHGLQSFARRLPWVLGEAFNQAGWYVSDLVKCIITGDPVEINPKNAPAISMKVNTPAFWGTNHPPKFKESSGSMATRMIIVPMTRTFDKENPIGVAAEARKHNPAWEPHDLIINTELPGVLRWALAGLRRALERGHFVNTEAGKDLLEQSRKDSNCAATFVDECLDADLNQMICTADVYATFEQWWISEHGDRAVVPSPTTFGHDLANLPNSRVAQDKRKFKNKASQRFYLGITLSGAGIGFWEDAANIARVSGATDHRMAGNVDKTSQPIPAAWKLSDEYRRVVPNIERVVEERDEREERETAARKEGRERRETYPWD